MFDLCLNALAVYGRLIVIGMISQVGYSTSLHCCTVTIFLTLKMLFENQN